MILQRHRPYVIFSVVFHKEVTCLSLSECVGILLNIDKRPPGIAEAWVWSYFPKVNTENCLVENASQIDISLSP